jgi:hypothetical protein
MSEEVKLTVEEQKQLELEKKKLQVMQNAFGEFRSNYIPTPEKNKEAILKTSGDLTIMFEEFTGLAISRFDMVNLMTGAGFAFKLIGNQFFWLMEEV